MKPTAPAQPSILSDPVFRKPQLPGALARPADLVLMLFALCGGLVGFSEAFNALRHLYADSAEALSLRELARIQESGLWLAAGFAVSLFASVLLIMRLLYRVHRCELLLRWSGIDESKLLEPPAQAGSSAGAPSS